MVFSSSSSSASTHCRTQTVLPLHVRSHSIVPRKFDKTTPFSPSSSRCPPIFCKLTKMAATAVDKELETAAEAAAMQRPDSFGRFGRFGGKYVPETLMYALTELEAAFKSLATDHEFQVLLLVFDRKIEYLNKFSMIDFRHWYELQWGCKKIMLCDKWHNSIESLVE